MEVSGQPNAAPALSLKILWAIPVVQEAGWVTQFGMDATERTTFLTSAGSRNRAVQLAGRCVTD
jgi:hypothetical protein